MSYTCSSCNEKCAGVPRVLVPVLKRQVIYRKYTVRNLKNVKDINLSTFDPDNLIFLDEYKGWEIVKEIPVCESKAKEIEESNSNNYVLEPKIVKFLVLSSPKRVYKRNSDSESEEETDKYLYE